MSYPTKVKGWRKLLVDGNQIRWRFLPGNEKSVLYLRGSDSSSGSVTVTLNNWHDIWLNADDIEKKVNSPLSVTPRYVTEIVRQMIGKGWQPDNPTSTVAFILVDDLITTKGEQLEAGSSPPLNVLTNIFNIEE